MKDKLLQKETWWTRWGVLWRVSLFLIALLLLSFLILTAKRADSETGIGNISVFLLVNLNILILLVLAVIVARNLFRLIFEWRNNILGSKLKVKLVAALVGITLIPTTILFIFASGLLNQAMEGWFSTQVENAISGAVTVSRKHFSLIKELVEDDSKKISLIIKNEPQGSLDKRVEEYRQNAGLFSITLLQDGVDRLKVESPSAGVEGFKEPKFSTEGINKALLDKPVTLSENEQAARFIRNYQSIIIDNKRYVLIVSRRVDPELSEAFDTVSDSFAGYEQLKLHRHPLRSGYVLTLALLTGLILFGALWVAFYIARQIVVPIERLAEGTMAVAKGNYDVEITAKSSDEMGMLISSFNQMLKDLKTSREEGEARKLLIETSFANLAVGVISFDREEKITSINHVAKKLFEIKSTEDALLKDLFKEEDFEKISPILKGVKISNEPQERQFDISMAGRTAQIVCTAGKILNKDKEWVGTLLLFDDITELKKAQQMSAWREVARRIAHEIKNPLTPIQLSAQRLEKISQDLPQETRIKECAEIIVENVDSIKRLANEFSNFARMPEIELKEGSINNILSDLITMFADSNTDVAFQFIADNNLPLMQLDIEQIRRMLINLLDNAVYAIGEKKDDVDFIPRVVVRTSYESVRNLCILEISDNGPGIPPENTFRIFEPYFTTKGTGTGLGLAIVMSIVTEHYGTLKVFNNKPHGAKFVIELPVQGRPTTQRRLNTESSI